LLDDGGSRNGIDHRVELFAANSRDHESAIVAGGDKVLRWRDTIAASAGAILPPRDGSG
jgi:hypothetical protein